MQIRIHIWFCASIVLIALVYGANPTYASEKSSVKHDLDHAADLFLLFEYENAEDILKPLHENGVSDATKLLAFLYSDSFGPLYEPAKALAFFKQLSKAGDTDASLQLFDSEYWADDAVSVTEAKALRAELFPALARTGEGVQRVAHARLALACLFDEVVCKEDVPKPIHPGAASSYGSEYNRINNVFRGSNELLTRLESGMATKAEKDISQSDAILYNSLVYGAANRSDPYSAPLIVLLKANKLLESFCQSVDPFVYLAIKVVEHNDLWHRLDIHSNWETATKIKSCIDTIPSRVEAYRHTYQAKEQLQTIEDYYELSIAMVSILNVEFPAEQSVSSYNNWCLTNVTVPDLTLCRARTYTDDVFRCSRTTLSAFIRSIDTPDSSKAANLILSNRKPGKFERSKRYNVCRQHFFEEAKALDSGH